MVMKTTIADKTSEMFLADAIKFEATGYDIAAKGALDLAVAKEFFELNPDATVYTVTPS